MNEKSSKPIWIIFPHEHLTAAAERILRKNNDLRVLCHICSADGLEPLAMARSAKAAKAKVIVSRGGTATLIRGRGPDVPVVDVAPNPALIVAQYVGLQEKHGKDNVLLVTSEEFALPKELIRGLQMLGYQQNIQRYSRVEEEEGSVTFITLKGHLERHRSQTASLFVFGDASACRIADSLGIPHEMIRSTEDDVLTALRAAVRYVKTAFIGAAMTDPEVEICVYKAIRPVLEEAGFEVLSEIGNIKPGQIVDQITEGITESTVVVVDVTKARPNCYHEVGLAQGQGKTVIITAKRGARIHSNISGERIIQWQNWKDLAKQLKDVLISLGHC